jgi:putative transposase
MRYSPAEKLEIIRLVEESELPVKRTLEELEVARSTFYRWYDRYQAAGYDGLADQKPGPQQFWNRIPDSVRQQVVEVALERPDQSPRQLAWHLTDTEGYFISETSVYRILKSFDLITSPVFDVVKASDKFENPTKRVNEMWQTDFTQFKVYGWGWYYLCTILDDFSRYIIAWRLSSTMAGSVAKKSASEYPPVTTRVIHLQPRQLTHGKRIQMAALRTRNDLTVCALVSAVCAQLS